MKIAIVGNAGSGKSTLAEELHKKLQLPLYHLDQYFWKPGWQRPDREEFAKVHHKLCDKNSWIIEGMAIRHFEYRAEKADIIIFLDMPLWRCLYRIFKRALFGYGQVRDSSAKECPEQMPTLEFLRYVWKFNQKQRLIINELLEKHKNRKTVIKIRNNKDIGDFLDTVKLKRVVMCKEILPGKIVTLKTLCEDHFKSYHDMLSSTVKAAVGIPEEQTFEETERFLKKKLIEIDQHKILFYCIFDNKNNELIGSIELREPGFFNGQLGCWINENYWGGGRYQEALDLLLQEYFACTDQRVVNVYIKKSNIRSLKAHEKYGFKIVREFEKDGGGFYELIYEK